MRPVHQPIKTGQIFKLIAVFVGMGLLVLVLYGVKTWGPYFYHDWQATQHAKQMKQEAFEKLSPQDKALAHKFRGLDGGELFVDAFGEKEGVNIFDENGKLFYKRQVLSARNNSKHSYGATFGVPKTLRVEWREAGAAYITGERTGAYEGGKVIAQYTVPVAERIPEEVLDAMRRNIGGFRLKIRIHDDGPLIGWDLSRGFNLQYFAGGDFREADIENGQVVRKGWYIHPKTKERIETDF